MNQELVTKAKQMLEEKKKNLETELSSFAKKDPNLKGDWDSTYPRIPEASPEEAASEVEEHERNLEVEFSLEKQLVQVHNALERIEKGTYGKCASCGMEIPQERIEIAPESAACAHCS
jgi:DnaK suppressor protein